MNKDNNFSTFGDETPVYRIDLSLPPSKRYVELASNYRDKLKALAKVFEDLVSHDLPGIPLNLFQRAARLLLRRLRTREETEEIKGISKDTGIDLYFFVILNVGLDLLMGCTSGAALTKSDAEDGTRMLHFRTLDWSMDQLRELIVQLEFVRSPDRETVLATSITYVGFVGVLTGVRKGLSVSLNYRSSLYMSSAWGSFNFISSYLLVLFGIRRSISSVLRQYLIPPSMPKASSTRKPPGRKPQHSGQMTLDQITATISKMPTTSTYLILCDGTSTVVMEKDLRSAVSHSSSSFIVVTNSDLSTVDASYHAASDNGPSQSKSNVGRISMADIIQDSNERRAYIQAKWDEKVQAARAQSGSAAGSPNPVDPATEVTATLDEIVQWTTAYPISNELTHFSTVMDPVAGKIVWLRRYSRPLQAGQE